MSRFLFAALLFFSIPACAQPIPAAIDRPFAGTMKLEVDADKLKGWPVQAAAPKAPVKKAAAAKKAAKK